MKSNLIFDFTVNNETFSVNVKREFAAEHPIVWDAFTKPELLDEWWAPKPYVSKTKAMEFKVGGRRIYSMRGPKGDVHWALADFTTINPKTNFQYWDSFCDEHGKINDGKPRSDWNLDFIDQGDTTLVDIAIKHKSLDDLEKIIEMGFREGFTIALDGLHNILINNKK